MQVARLEIFGFKSFMERLVLPLEPGVTGVVGPNGCGKSNIVDALRWVLGETKARSLRGGSLEDVIFNGTDKLRPLGLAEVTLTLRASEKDFFADLISPTLEADLIANDPQSPLAEDEEDELQLEQEEEEDAESSASEGESAKPHLTVVDGLLGVEAQAQDESKKSAAKAMSREERLATTATLLQRFSWLKSVNEVQVTRRLYRSGESEFFINRVACRLKDIKELFRAVGLGARAYTIVAQGELSRIISSKPEERRQILEEAAGILGFRDRIMAAQRRLEETDINLARLSDIGKEVGRQVGSLKRQASRARNRQELKDEIARLERALYQSRLIDLKEKTDNLESAFGGAQEAEDGLTARLHKEQAEEQAARSELMSVDLQGDNLRARIDAIKEELNNRARQRGEKQARVSELRALCVAAAEEISRLEERRGTFIDRKAACQLEIERLLGEGAELEAKVAALDAVSGMHLGELNQEISRLRQGLSAKDDQIRIVHDQLIADRSSLTSIEEQLAATSPLAQLRETRAQEQVIGLESVERARLLMDGLTIPEKFAKAAQAALAERALFLVSPDWQDVARGFVEMAGTLEEDQKQRLGLGVFKAGKQAPAAISGISFPRLLDEIQTEEAHSLAVVRLLDKVYVAETVEQALGYFNGEDGADKTVTLVTLSGEVVTDYSFFTLNQEGGAIQLRDKAVRLQNSCTQAEAEEVNFCREREELRRSIVEAEARQNAAIEQNRLYQAEAREVGGKLGNIHGRLEAEKKQQAQVEQDIAKALSQVEGCHRRIAEFQAEEARVEAEMAALKPDDEEQLQHELGGFNEEYRTLDEVRKAGRLQLSKLAEIVQATRDELDQARALMANLTLDRQKLELDGQNLKERVESDYGEAAYEAMLNDSAAQVMLSPEMRTEYHDEVAKIKARILREGDVDPDSIQRLEEEQARLDELLRQQQDLEHAAATLKTTIERLTETSKRRFMATFEAVKENYAKLIPRLFGGGRGSIELSNYDNPLESGLDIIARPPGKKLKSIELLSGGEKALCAAALMFAMFLERPSPLCVLDEVDAPLDDANLVRFLGMIKELSAKTQFVNITHNKQSMSVCDNLIGVTMAEPGASTVLSVSLQEAYTQVA